MSSHSSSAVGPQELRPLDRFTLQGPLKAPIPTTIMSVTKDYLETIMKANNAMDEACYLEKIECRRIGEGKGFNSHCGIFDLNYKKDGDGGEVAHSTSRNPLKIVCKVMPPFKQTVCPAFLLARFWEAEILLVNHMSEFQGVEGEGSFKFPLCYYAAMRKDKEKKRHIGIILMQAITHIPPGNHVVPLIYRQCRAGLVNLARFHAKFWCGDDPKNLARNNPGLKRIRSVTERGTGVTTKYMIETGGFRDVLLMPEYAKIHSLVAMFSRKVRGIANELRKGPFTISHGDTKSDNFFFEDAKKLPDLANPETNYEALDGGDECITCDFQLSTICNPCRDVVGFLILNLGSENRKLWFRQLCAVYREELSRNGVVGYSEEQMMCDFPVWLLWPLLMDIACAHQLRLFLEKFKEETDKIKNGNTQGQDYEAERRRYIVNQHHRERLFSALEDFEVEGVLAKLGNDCRLPFFGCCCVWALK
ncbi:hypothetical protein TrLO_g9913 [Triparma laevis f. longispina]|uniref:CHK kinase-like domain-containing protein n=1 Tax=Triparma laevis f. longispina TaxID=1714387 RepID=A0A9W6ZWA1_9STRA|nr:hypothetical protein TrLO_g9913 [Triparma laevis f. longispina]